LHSDVSVKDGQMAHLDRNPANSTLDNLAYLCLECHKAYDMKSTMVMAYTPGEVLRYREQLYWYLGHDKIEWTITIRASRSQYDEVRRAVDEAHSLLRRCSTDVSLSEEPIG